MKMEMGTRTMMMTGIESERDTLSSADGQPLPIDQQVIIVCSAIIEHYSASRMTCNAEKEPGIRLARRVVFKRVSCAKWRDRARRVP